MCSECNGMYSGCPCQHVTPEFEKCTICNGEGKIYMNDDGIQLSKEEWLKLPEDERSWDECFTCDQTGEVCINVE